MENLDKAIEVLQAFKEGKTIEYHNCKDVWVKVNPDESIIDKIYTYSDLRIKPELKYRPYTNAKEFLEDSKEHGPYIDMGNTHHYLPVHVTDIQICFNDGSFKVKSYYELKECKWQDGTPCGVLE